MKLRHWLLLGILVFLSSVSCFGQTDFVTANLTATASACNGIRNTASQLATYTVGFGSAVFTIEGPLASTTVGFFASGDGGTSWGALAVTPSEGGSPVTTATTDGKWQANVAAYTHICMLRTAGNSTVYAKVHLSPIAARSGGGAGGISLPPGALDGQTLGISNGMVVAASPGLADAMSSPHSTGTLTPSCGTGNTGDKARIFVITGGQVHIPQSSATHCANSVFYFLVQAASVVFSRTGADTFSIYDGGTHLAAQTTYTARVGQYLTIVNGRGAVWHLLAGTSAASNFGQGISTALSTSNAGATSTGAGVTITPRRIGRVLVSYTLLMRTSGTGGYSIYVSRLAGSAVTPNGQNIVGGTTIDLASTNVSAAGNYRTETLAIHDSGLTVGMTYTYVLAVSSPGAMITVDAGAKIQASEQ